MPADIALLYELSANIGRLKIHRLVTSDIALGKPSSKNERLLPSCHTTPAVRGSIDGGYEGYDSSAISRSILDRYNKPLKCVIYQIGKRSDVL